MAKGKSTVALVEEMARPVAAGFGVDIWDVRFEKEGPTWYLRIFLDKEGGVDVLDCENVSRALDPLLDEADPIQQSYVLEVSSPGLGRRLARPAHFQRALGQLVEARFIRPDEEGRRDVEGVLEAYDDGSVTLRQADDTTISFPTARASYIKLCDDRDLF